MATTGTFNKNILGYMGITANMEPLTETFCSAADGAQINIANQEFILPTQYISDRGNLST